MQDNLNFFDEFNKSPEKETLKNNPIAYFCAEFALTSSMPIYAGGLGVLAGDLLREASDRSFPIVGVGLYYNDGYETLHNVNEEGFIAAPHIHKSPESFGLEPVMGDNEKPIKITIPIEGRQVAVRAWRWQTGTIPVFLLDTDCEENASDDRRITDHLYVIDRQMRLKQEIVLGIGGARMLREFKVDPAAYHMNDGHPSLLSYELIGRLIKEKHLSFDDAVREASGKIVFTNHTLVTGGQEIFNDDLISLLLSDFMEEMGIPANNFLSLGRIQDASSFSLTQLSFNVAGATNAVSKIHSKYAKGLWPNHPLQPITNGIHVPSWNGIKDEAFWESHIENKRALLAKIHMMKNLDWQDTDFIIAWARRLVEYKRPTAMLDDIAKLKEMLNNSDKPVRFVFSGRLHPSDTTGEEILKKVVEMIEKEVPGSAVFLPDYDLDLARLLTSGCDIWVNTPIVGFEACGTSGMKAALNGVLPVSTLDGWIAEIDLLGRGFPLDNDNITASLMGILKNEIIPLFFERDEKGVPQKWLANMKNCREMIKNDFSATRMLREYIERLYTPFISRTESHPL
ncbi:MAG TPA: alpha-glucan family phosphorylase [Patescibacteria group bacterium]|nr:alpha-glucan family phosphorylase [Patescibacteria group bacterium]